MSNYETAKLVRSVVSERDLIPIMTHFHMYTSRLQGTNSKLTLDAPWPEYINEEPINIPADPFVKAFETMDNPNVVIRDEFLYVSEGKMKVKIPLSPDPFPICKKPEGWDPMDNSIKDACAIVRPFISEDASRPWACGAKYIGGHLYATNNIVIVRTPWEIGSTSEITEFDVPGFGVDQLVKCRKDVTGIHIRESAIGFEMGDVWMESVRYTDPWRDIQPMYERFDWDDIPALSGQEYDIVEKLIPFVPDRRHPVIRFEGDKIATMEGGMEAAVEIDCGTAYFHATPLMDVLRVATHMQFDVYPKPVPFKGPGVQGIIAGVHV